MQERRELSEEVPDDAGLPDAVHRHHLLLLGHLLQGPPEQEERPAAHEVSCCFDFYSTCVFLSVRLRELLIESTDRPSDTISGVKEMKLFQLEINIMKVEN